MIKADLQTRDSKRILVFDNLQWFPLFKDYKHRCGSGKQWRNSSKSNDLRKFGDTNFKSKKTEIHTVPKGAICNYFFTRLYSSNHGENNDILLVHVQK